jgi:hypothetical protein
MTLSALMRKRENRRVATAIPAIFATPTQKEAPTVARIATVAVANPKKTETANPAKVMTPQAAAAFPDDRRTCRQCANLEGRRCMAAKRGEIVASPDYEPVRNIPRRCEGYAAQKP